MSLLGMQQKIQSAKSLDASRATKSTTGFSKELDRMIDNARAELALANSAAEKYFKIQPGDPLAGTEDRMISMIPPDVQANVIAARDRLDALNRIAMGGGTQFDATQ
jgi:flagellar hook-basal body complex protein FliE